MEIIRVDPAMWSKIKDRVVRFIQKYGEGRITRKAIRWLKELNGEHLQKNGTFILIAAEEKKILGVIAVSNYGIDQSVVVVNPEVRQRGVGKTMIQHLLEHAEKLYGRVALDNIPSLKMCFSIGMVGFKLVEGPTGKPTLWLGLGNWKKEDVE